MAGRRSSYWYYYTPGMVYAQDLRFLRPVSESFARAYLRDIYKAERLLRNTVFWPGKG